MSRCDSAAMVSKTREVLPDPDTPVKTVSALVDAQVDVLEVVLAGSDDRNVFAFHGASV